MKKENMDIIILKMGTFMKENLNLIIFMGSDSYKKNKKTQLKKGYGLRVFYNSKAKMEIEIVLFIKRQLKNDLFINIS